MVDFLGESGLGLLVDHRLGYVEQIIVIQLVRDRNDEAFLSIMFIRQYFLT